MAATTFIDPPQLSPGAPGPLYVPGVRPLDGPVGTLSLFVRLLRNPLSVLPAAVYDQGIVFAGRAGRAVCWITEPSLIKTVLLDRRDIFDRTAIHAAHSGAAARQWGVDRGRARLEMAASDGGTRLPPQ